VGRLNGREIKYIREELEKKYPEYCVNCGKTPKQLGVTKLELHEIKYDRPLNSENFILLCKKCNHPKPQNVNLIVGTSSITAEHRKNLEKEPFFRRLLHGEIMKPENNFHLPYYETLAWAAYEVGVSIDTISRRYIPVLTDHPTSPYVTKANNFGQMEIWVRGYEPVDEVLF